MYDVYLDKILLPVAPSRIQLSIKNQNKTVNLINGHELNVLKAAGLSEISFTALIPQVQYPFATYPSGFKGAAFFLDAFEALKTSKKPFPFIVFRKTPDGTSLFNTGGTDDFLVSMEEYSITDDVEEGFDLTVEIQLKQYRSIITQKVAVSNTQSPTATATVSPQRPADTAPTTKNYTVVKGDSLWAIARKFYNDGSQYTKIYNANKDKISNPNLIYPGQVLKIP